MDDYMNNYESFRENCVYNFNIGDGGIGDCIKFFMFVLKSCMKNKTRLYYKKNNISVENYIKLKYDKIYISEDMMKQLDCVSVIIPQSFYSSFKYDDVHDIGEVFYFTDEVKINCKYLMQPDITNYISIHLRLGDKYLETDKNFVLCRGDEREFSEEKIHNFIEKNYDKNIFFCCDNNDYKLKIKEKYNKIITTTCDIGHTSLSNTNEKQILDGITEFYILTNSEMIFRGSESGFSIIASKFNNIPLLN